jgi:hypothetical protein
MDAHLSGMSIYGGRMSTYGAGASKKTQGENIVNCIDVKNYALTENEDSDCQRGDEPSGEAHRFLMSAGWTRL